MSRSDVGSDDGAASVLVVAHRERRTANRGR